MQALDQVMIVMGTAMEKRILFVSLSTFSLAVSSVFFLFFHFHVLTIDDRKL